VRPVGRIYSCIVNCSEFDQRIPFKILQDIATYIFVSNKYFHKFRRRPSKVFRGATEVPVDHMTDTLAEARSSCVFTREYCLIDTLLFQNLSFDGK
jgi:YHS domain-containing protein